MSARIVLTAASAVIFPERQPAPRRHDKAPETALRQKFFIFKLCHLLCDTVSVKLHKTAQFRNSLYSISISNLQYHVKKKAYTAQLSTHSTNYAIIVCAKR
jgi:hypothetical protein